MASVNAEEVNTNILTKTDPDISDLQFDMLEGINTNETIQQQIDNVSVDITGLEADVLTLQGEMITANSNISTLQGQMTTANNNISTLQGQMTTANSNISTLQSQYSTLNGEVNTLQSEMNDAQADIGALYGISATNTASITGLSISQASQDVIITAHTASIAGLNTDVGFLQTDVTALEVKTTDQSWASLSRTTFSSRVNIGSTSAGVILYTTVASEFGSGLTSTGAISTTSTLTSTSGTSQVSSLLVNNNLEVTNSSFFGDTIYVDRAILTNSKKVVLYDNSTGNDYDYLGFWSDSGTASKKFLNAEIDGVTGSAFQWYYGNNLGSSRTLAKSLSSADEINYTPKATFLKSAGASQQIQLVRDTANNKVRIDMIGDIAGANTFDGQIIQQEGNGVDDNRGIMTIQSGDINITAQTSATTGTLQLNSKVLDINNSGAIMIDGATTTTITSVDDMTLQTTNPFGDILVTSAGTTTLTSVGQTQINSSTFDLNATGALTVDSDGGMTFTEATGLISLDANNIELTSTLNTTITTGDALFGVSGTNTWMTVENTVDGPNIFLTGGDIQIETTGSGTGNMSLTANANLNLTSNTQNINLQSQTVVNHNLRISQDSYTQPMASTFQLGYTNTATSSAVMTAVLAQRASFTLPQKGVWLIVLGYQWTGGATNTITLKQAVISATSASATPASAGLRYYEAIDAGVTAVLQQQGTIMGVYTATASTILYLNALATVTTSTLPTLAWSISWTRIG
jgi:hypothetical protein